MIPGFFAAGAMGSGGSDDPYWSSVSCLLHFDGSDGSTTFTDETGKIWSAFGSAEIDTSEYVFGGASGLFDDDATSITTPDSDDFFLDGDFTQEFWYRPHSIGIRQFLCGQGDSGASDIRSMVEINAAGGIKYWADNTNTLTTSSTTLSADTWYFIAVTKLGDDYNIWLDGVSVASKTDSSVPTNYSGAFYIGRCGDFPTLRARGHIDDFRITKGVARYTTTFTPPVAPFPDG